MYRLVTYKDIARAIANAYDPSGSVARYYRADGTPTVNLEEAQYMSRYNSLTKRLRVLLYPHHDTIGSFYIGDDEEGDADYYGFEIDSARSG
mgnify:CR=1 FL=1